LYAVVPAIVPDNNEICQLGYTLLLLCKQKYLHNFSRNLFVSHAGTAADYFRENKKDLVYKGFCKREVFY